MTSIILSLALTIIKLFLNNKEFDNKDRQAFLDFIDRIQGKENVSARVKGSINKHKADLLKRINELK